MTRAGDTALPSMPAPPHVPWSLPAQHLRIGLERLPVAAYVYDDADEDTVVYENVVAPLPPPLFSEPFNSLAAWTTNGTPTIIAGGRTGNGLSVGTTATTRASHALAAGEQSDYLMVGFAWRTDSLANQRDIVQFFSDTNVTQHNRLRVLVDGGLVVTGEAGNNVATSAPGLVAANTWTYIELQCRLHDTLGAVIVRVNATTVINAAGVDTKNAGTKTVYDAVRLATATAGATNLYDDLYLDIGATAVFRGDITIP